jgi:hypothetical protein
MRSYIHLGQTWHGVWNQEQVSLYNFHASHCNTAHDVFLRADNEKLQNKLAPISLAISVHLSARNTWKPAQRISVEFDTGDLY